MPVPLYWSLIGELVGSLKIWLLEPDHYMDAWGTKMFSARFRRRERLAKAGFGLSDKRFGFVDCVWLADLQTVWLVR